MSERTEDTEASEVWLHGLSDEDPRRRCPNCDQPIDQDRLAEPGEDQLLLCPDCGAELPWSTATEVPTNDWFNWACLEKVEYADRECFDEPHQQALSLAVSIADPRGADLGLEITTTRSGDLLVKVENRETFTYTRHVSTSIEGSYTVVRFRRPQ